MNHFNSSLFSNLSPVTYINTPVTPTMQLQERQETRGNWTRIWDPDTSRNYYANQRTYHKSWEKPKEWDNTMPHSYLSLTINNQIPTPPDPQYKCNQTWLSSRKLLDQINDEYITNHPKFVHNIIALTFGNWKQLIYHLINTANEKQTNVIHQILIEEKIKYDDTQQQQQQQQQNDQLSYFDRLSLTSITTICGYLTKSDIKHFKLTCSSIAVQCLLEMQKYGNVGVFNINQLRCRYKYKYLSLFRFMKTNKIFNVDRYSKSITDDPTLYMKIWSDKYNIPKQDLLLVLSNSSFAHSIPDLLRYTSILQTEYMINPININYGKSTLYRVLLFDKRDLILINKNGAINTKSLSKFDGTLNNSRHVVILLYYFDIKQQYTEYNQSLIVESGITINDLTHCIESNIELFVNKILNDDDRNEFLDVFNSYRSIELWRQFRQKINNLLASYDGCINTSMLIAFSLTSHGYQYVDQCKKYCKTLGKRFYASPWNLGHDILHKLNIREQNMEKMECENGLRTMQPIVFRNMCSFLNCRDIIQLSFVSISMGVACLTKLRRLKEFDELTLPLLDELEFKFQKKLISQRLLPKIQLYDSTNARIINQALLQLGTCELLAILGSSELLYEEIRRIIYGDTAIPTHHTIHPYAPPSTIFMSSPTPPQRMNTINMNNMNSPQHLPMNRMNNINMINNMNRITFKYPNDLSHLNNIISPPQHNHTVLLSQPPPPPNIISPSPPNTNNMNSIPLVSVNNMNIVNKPRTSITQYSKFGSVWISPFKSRQQNRDFFMCAYKCQMCPLRRNCQEKVTCPGWHHQGEKRRNPGESPHFLYSETPCPNVKPSGSNKWLKPSICMNGDQCIHSHSLLEQMYHPNAYKTSMCINFTNPQGNKCRWGYYCTHAHGQDDIRNPNVAADDNAIDNNNDDEKENDSQANTM